MPTLLRIDASSRTDGSHSRFIADRAVAAWRAATPQGVVVERAVADGSIPVLSQETIEGFYTPDADMTDALRAATALSDTLIDELQSADLLLISAPIYNFTAPAALKLWIDQVVRIGRTFAVETGAFKGLARTPKAVVVCVYGAEGYGKGEVFAPANFLEPYLDFLLGFLGIRDVRFVTLQGSTGARSAVEARREAAARAAEAAVV